ncbi:hypothetical protein BCR42DRAFT_425766 [Absidia repens]|uniref:Ser-Thr-rich glycosyl-phosphatidyl-inositol-anchored membrane family-domain-containing protein n=1 Tax=Absidia repens TaxID=90262 RepID=A0A1X2I1R1_9FUNG|nr:hypothetical protein BCR42DRAFT_425766 [Absidia repens]
MYSASLVILTLIAQSGSCLVFRLPTYNSNVYPGESNLIAWSDFGDVTAVTVYLAHGTESNYTILQTIGENIPSSTNSMMYHLPTTLPPTNVFFMLEGNDSPKSVTTRPVYVDSSRGGFDTFPSISFPSSFPSTFPSISFPSNFPFGLPTASPIPNPTPTHTHSGLPMPAIIGIVVGSVVFLFIVLVTAIIMKRRTIRRNRLALQLLQQQQRNETSRPPPNWSQKPTDINVNVALHGLEESQPLQQTEQHTEYNYNPQYQYEQQMDNSYTNQSQQPYSSPGGFIVPSPKTATSFAGGYPLNPTHDSGLHNTSPPTELSTTSTIVYPPAPAYQKVTSTKTSVSGIENKPNQASSPIDVSHKPNEVVYDKPHSNITTQKPHSDSPPL